MSWVYVLLSRMQDHAVISLIILWNLEKKKVIYRLHLHFCFYCPQATALHMITYAVEVKKLRE